MASWYASIYPRRQGRQTDLFLRPSFETQELSAKMTPTSLSMTSPMKSSSRRSVASLASRLLLLYESNESLFFLGCTIVVAFVTVATICIGQQNALFASFRNEHLVRSECLHLLLTYA
ncbi:unnamed protein product [Protopolystoma xenopodis]|uniref:Uncharacterized protein n=1 Tax=Protopolystoma xenopodis TaxID=117903 RepID=A0A3S5BD39_9PLAT|nr:unnamed protein product [Protopolystoma xenopodis]